MRKKSRIRGRITSLSGPFDTTDHKTERMGVALLMHWMRRIIEDRHLDLGFPDVETSGTDRKMPDAVIYESRRSPNILCVIEAKRPSHSIFDEKELKDPARLKANHRKAKYFCVTNFKTLFWYKTAKANMPDLPEEEQIVQKYNLSEIENLNDIEQTRYSEQIKRGLDDFLSELYSVHSGREAEPKQAVDEWLVYRLHEKIKTLSQYYKSIIYDQCHKDRSFALNLKKWFDDQKWLFSWEDKDFDTAARQTAYLLVNKILFYEILQAKRPRDLDPLEIPGGLTKGALLQRTLQAYFEQVLKIDYETIYDTDFIDGVAFPDCEEVVEEVKELVSVLRKYDFSKIGYDIVGRIFEALIPPEERHALGQYFTNADVVDLILKFCLSHEDEKIIDPACGAGTFLVRAYQHKKIMNQRKTHEDVLDSLWGVDIAKFPAHLSTINLAINDLGVDKNYPNILHEDFFNLRAAKEGFEAPEKWRKARAKTLGKQEREIIYPRWFDAIVGNPPYTRQEEIQEIGVDKDNLIENALDFMGKRIADISKRAGIHSYFFVHGTKFLKDAGHFGFIVSSSWLDVDYGKGLQEFFLNNYKIVALIESKVERWFADADINTCIVILQKCRNKRERDENLVRFIYLKKPLRYFIPAAQDIWEKQVERLNAIDNLKRTVLAHNSFYENEELRIFPKNQKELWAEGYDSDENRYTGSKWGKYLRAPEIFFTILEKGRDKLVPLKEIAKVRRGFTTGANEFFYLAEEEIKRKGIEKNFWTHKDQKGNILPNYLVESPSDLHGYTVKPEELKKRVLLIHLSKPRLKGKKIADYILRGEQKKFHKRDTCKQNALRKKGRWYDLDEISANILFPEYTRSRLVTFYSEFPVFINNRLYGIYADNPLLIWGLLNSTVFHLFAELAGPQPGGGGGPRGIRVYDLKAIPIPYTVEQGTDIEECSRNLQEREVLTIFEELGAFSPEEVALEKVNPDRRELDRIVMGKTLGLTDEEQVEVYRAVVDLVKSRIEKAKSLKSRKGTNGTDIYALKDTIVERIIKEQS